MKKTGACLCGGVSYEVEGDLVGIVNCHCKDCQRLHGIYNPMLITALANVTFTKNQPQWYRSSEAAERGFCGTCGAAMFKKLLKEERLLIAVGNFDDTTGLHNIKNIWEQSKGDYYVTPEISG